MASIRSFSVLIHGSWCGERWLVSSHSAGKWQSPFEPRWMSSRVNTWSFSLCWPQWVQAAWKVQNWLSQRNVRCILPWKPPAQQGRRFTVLYPGIQLELASLQQAEQVNQLYIFLKCFFFLSQINTVFPSNHLMRGREGNGKVEHAVCTKVTLKMVAWSRQCTRAKDTQPLVLGGGGGDRKQA